MLPKQRLSAKQVAQGRLAVDSLGAEVGAHQEFAFSLQSLGDDRCRCLPFRSLFPNSRRRPWKSRDCLRGAGGGQFLRSLLQAMKVAAAPVTFICAVLSASIASIGLRLGIQPNSAGNIHRIRSSSLAPGLPLINGFIDVVSHEYLVVGIERDGKCAVPVFCHGHRNRARLYGHCLRSRLMDFRRFFSNSLWAAIFATGMGILLTAPFRYLVPTFLCGFAGRFVRDISMGWGMSQNWSTVVATAVLVLLTQWP